MDFHVPVMVEEVLHYLDLKEGGVYLDCTTGGGGHLKAIAEKTSTARLIGIDCDQEALEFAEYRLSPFAPRIRLTRANFRNLKAVLKFLEVDEVDGILFDLGVSLHQLAEAHRGFGFDVDGPLDMRMDLDSTARAQDLINHANVISLRDTLKNYGEVRNASQLARNILDSRTRIKTTQDLRNVIARSVPARYLKKTLAQVFQAIRISVNSELDNLKVGLTQAQEVLKKKAGLS